MLVDFAGDLSDLTHSSTHSLSTLYLPSVDLADSGNYSCQPASLHKVSITLHVLKAEKEQKLSVKETSDSVSHSHLSPIVLLLLNLCIIYQPRWSKHRATFMTIHLLKIIFMEEEPKMSLILSGNSVWLLNTVLDLILLFGNIFQW